MWRGAQVINAGTVQIAVLPLADSRIWCRRRSTTTCGKYDSNWSPLWRAGRGERCHRWAAGDPSASFVRESERVARETLNRWAPNARNIHDRTDDPRGGVAQVSTSLPAAGVLVSAIGSVTVLPDGLSATSGVFPWLDSESCGGRAVGGR
jgi:hypothetical protein